MYGYWDSVPKGTWTVIDPIDTINALNDEDSRFRHYPEDNRIVIYGSKGKALIVELTIVLDSFREDDLGRDEFIVQLKKYNICI